MLLVTNATEIDTTADANSPADDNKLKNMNNANLTSISTHSIERMHLPDNLNLVQSVAEEESQTLKNELDENNFLKQIGLYGNVYSSIIQSVDDIPESVYTWSLAANEMYPLGKEFSSQNNPLTLLPDDWNVTLNASLPFGSDFLRELATRNNSYLVESFTPSISRYSFAQPKSDSQLPLFNDLKMPSYAKSIALTQPLSESFFPSAEKTNASSWQQQDRQSEVLPNSAVQNQSIDPLKPKFENLFTENHSAQGFLSQFIRTAQEEARKARKYEDVPQIIDESRTGLSQQGRAEDREYLSASTRLSVFRDMQEKIVNDNTFVDVVDNAVLLKEDLHSRDSSKAGSLLALFHSEPKFNTNDAHDNINHNNDDNVLSENKMTKGTESITMKQSDQVHRSKSNSIDVDVCGMTKEQGDGSMDLSPRSASPPTINNGNFLDEKGKTMEPASSSESYKADSDLKVLDALQAHLVSNRALPSQFTPNKNRQKFNFDFSRDLENLRYNHFAIDGEEDHGQFPVSDFLKEAALFRQGSTAVMFPYLYPDPLQRELDSKMSMAELEAELRRVKAEEAKVERELRFVIERNRQAMYKCY